MTEPKGIRLNSLVKHYSTAAGVVRAVDGIDLEIAPRSSVAIMGPSGCGKSTLLGLIAGLEAPTNGAIRVGDHEMSAMPEGERSCLRREEIGLIFQSDDLMPFLTATENVELQLRLAGSTDASDEPRRLLSSLGLEEHANKLPDQLSGGQRHRVGIARALVHRPGLVLADEPTGELDATTTQTVLDVLLAAQRESGVTLVVVTHDASVGQRMDRMLHLRDGRLADA